MKKSLLAAATLLAATGAVAQSSVTMYGLIDTGIWNEKQSISSYDADGNLINKREKTTTGPKSGYMWGPRVGFRGEEALGNGLSATFNLEMGFNSTTGEFGQVNNAAAFSRRSVVGLKGSFGHVTLGRNNTPVDNYAMDVDGNTRGDAKVTGLYTGLHYEGNFSGLRIQAMVGGDKSSTKVGDTETEKKSDTGYGLGLRYTMDNFMVGAAVQQFKGANKTKSHEDATRTEWGLAASYDFGVARLRSHYVSSQNKIKGSNKYSKWEHFNVGVSVPVGAATLYAEYGRNRASALGNGRQINVDHVQPDGKGYGAIAAADFGIGHDFRVKGSGNSFMVGADYNISKRTLVYARARHFGDLKANVSNATTGAHVGKVKGYNNQFIVGLKHVF